jgi:hypothetical protein
MSFPQSVNFGAGSAGLGTVGYTLLANNGTTAQARTITGVTELVANSGIYGAIISEVVSAARIVWDTGGATPKYAIDDLPSVAADVLLCRSLSTTRALFGTPPTRSLINGLARLVNRSRNLNNVVSVYAEDDSTIVYTAALTGEATAVPTEWDPT